MMTNEGHIDDLFLIFLTASDSKLIFSYLKKDKLKILILNIRQIEIYPKEFLLLIRESLEMISIFKSKQSKAYWYFLLLFQIISAF